MRNFYRTIKNNHDDGDTSESLIKEAKKEFNYDIQDRCINADRLEWKMSK